MSGTKLFQDSAPIEWAAAEFDHGSKWGVAVRTTFGKRTIMDAERFNANASPSVVAKHCLRLQRRVMKRHGHV